MELHFISPEDLALILIIALILLGPRDMQKVGLMIGKFLRKVITSDGWKVFQQTSREIQNLPTRLMREAQLDELKSIQSEIHNELKQTADTVQQGTRLSQPVGGLTPKRNDPPNPENTILPPPAASLPTNDKENDA